MNRTFTTTETTMANQYGSTHSALQMAGWLLLLAMLLFSTHTFGAETQQKTFATPDEAVNALVAAAKADDANAIRAVLGNDRGDLSSGDAVADRALRQQFVTAYDAKHAMAPAGEAMTLVIGTNDFPFAFPLVKSGARWHFDTEAGKHELLARRIGGNELDAIKVLQAIADAQREYASADRNGDGVMEYAMKFASSPGKRDGLYWPAKAGESPSPLGEIVVRAAGEGYRANQKTPTPFHGYYFRMLKGQTASAPGGATDFVVKGRAIGGFAVVAYPTKYASSGIMTLMINQDGTVYQADLGPETLAKASKMQKFDVDSHWSKATTP